MTYCDTPTLTIRQLECLRLCRIRKLRKQICKPIDYLFYVRSVATLGVYDWVKFKLYGHGEFDMTVADWRTYMMNAKAVKWFDGDNFVPIE